MHQRRLLTRNISISIPSEKIEFIDRRAAALGLSRSQYICQLVKDDLRQLFVKELAKNSHRKLKSAINPDSSKNGIFMPARKPKEWIANNNVTQPSADSLAEHREALSRLRADTEKLCELSKLATDV